MSSQNFSYRHAFALGLFVTSLPLAWAQAKAPDTRLNGLIVDKKSNSLLLVSFDQPTYTVLKTYHTTLGTIVGDKEKEGDKKTPEGIYFFEEVRRPPRLLKKFGRMALTMNYPNAWDRLMKHTGSGIWLHSTDEPKRLAKDFDSLGCVVVKDEEIAELYPQVRHRTSPIMVYDDFQKHKDLLKPERLARLETFVRSWAQDWSGKNLESYLDHYHESFTNNGKDLKQWKSYKRQLNQNYASISVQLSHIYIFAHPKYDVAMFNQIYESRLKNGAVAKRTSGVKILYLAKDSETPKILSEEFRDTEL
jgi:murein L,D-transpeptidase YafK